MGAFTLAEAALEAVRRPGVIGRRVRTVLSSGYYNRKRVAWLSRLTSASESIVLEYIREVQRNRPFIQSLRRLLAEHTRYFPLPTDFMVNSAGNTLFFHCVSLYALVRIARPSIVVETGGTPGKSSAFILCALDRNTFGKLYTVDLPPPVAGEAGWQGHLMPKHAYEFRASPSQGPGWIIPADLKKRHELILGGAREALPPLLEKLGEVDIFIHDSDHSYEHMSFEFEAAWPFIRRGGYLWSDDINANDSWEHFCARNGIAGTRFTTQGATRKEGFGGVSARM